MTNRKLIIPPLLLLMPFLLLNTPVQILKEDKSFCLRTVDPAHDGQYQLIDPHSQIVRPVESPPPFHPLSDLLGKPDVTKISADNQYRAYVTLTDKPDAIDNGDAWLVIELVVKSGTQSDTAIHLPLGHVISTEGIANTFEFAWSSRGHRLMEFSHYPSTRLTLIDPDQKSLKTIQLPHENGYYYGLAWSADDRYVGIVDRSYGEQLQLISVSDMSMKTLQTFKWILWNAWSPVGHHWVYLSADQNGNRWVVLVDPDSGSERVLGPATKLSSGEFGERILFWDVDGHSLVYLRPDGKMAALTRIDVDTGITETLIENIVQFPYYIAPAFPYIYAISQQSDGKLLLYTMDTKNMKRQLLLTAQDNVQRVDQVSAPDNERKLVVVWSDNVRIMLTTAHFDATQRSDSKLDFDKLEDMYWLSDKQTFYFVARHGNFASLGLIDTQTNTLYWVVENVSRIALWELQSDADANSISAWWSLPDGNGEIHSYGPQGRLNYSFKMLGTLPEGLPRERPYIIVDVELSPDRQVALLSYENIKLSNDANRPISAFQLATASWAKFLTPIQSEAGAFAWSPDSSMLAFVYKTRVGQIVLEIVDPTGQKLWQASNFSDLYTRFDWLPCAK